MRYFDPPFFMKTLLAVLLFLPLSKNSFSQDLTKENFQDITARFATIGVTGITSSVKSNLDNHTGRYSVLSSELIAGSGKVQFFYDVKKREGKLYRSPVYVKVIYRGENWLFIDELSCAMIEAPENNEEIKRCKVQLKDPSRNVNSGGNINEIAVDRIPIEMIKFFKQINNNPRAITMRLSGEGKYVQYKLSGKKVKKETINFFKSLDLFEEKLNH